MKIEDLMPTDGPSINEVKKYIDKYKNDLIVIKYGGNVFIDRNIFDTSLIGGPFSGSIFSKFIN